MLVARDYMEVATVRVGELALERGRFFPLGAGDSIESRGVLLH